MPAPAKFRSLLRSCRSLHPLRKVRGRLQKTGGIHPVRQIPHIQIRQGASARFPGLRIHRGGRKWIWPAGSILSCEQPYGHKIRYRKLPGKAVPGFCQKLIFRFWFLRSGSWPCSSEHRKHLRSVRKKSRSRTSSGSQVQKKKVLIM